jgi:8-hydroxy-5-deazaflavin:NADPH oxidoreductase
MKTIKVGILGAGDVAKALARGFIALGHEVKLGARTPEKLDTFVAEAGAHASSGTLEDAATFGDLIVLATLGVGTLEAIELAGKARFRGKVVIDVCNPLDHSAGIPRLTVGYTDSLGEQIQRAIPEARVVKAFNTVGNPHMFKPDFPGGPPDMFICGNDDAAKKQVGQVCQAFGWGVIDIGGIEGSRYLEPMCMTWVMHGIKSGKWDHAFKMLHR